MNQGMTFGWWVVFIAVAICSCGYLAAKQSECSDRRGVLVRNVWGGADCVPAASP